MATIKNCNLPDDLLYHVANNEWLQDLGDGTYKLGMTDIAQAMAGSVIHCRMKKIGKKVRAGKSLATVESGKWVGPVKAPFACEVVAVNEAINTEATLLNTQPYTGGWMLQIKPIDPADASRALSSGQAAMDGFVAYMEDHDFDSCVPTDE